VTSAAAWLARELDTPWMRPPMPPVQLDEIVALRALLGGVGIETISEEQAREVLAHRPVEALATTS
jgi:hypothetical protein